MKFNNSNHVVAYCMAILKNKEIKLDRGEIKLLNSIDFILDYLLSLKLEDVIDYNTDKFYNSIVENTKGNNIHNALSSIKNTIKYIKRQQDGKLELEHIIRSIERNFSMDLCFTENYIENNLNHGKVRTLIRCDGVGKIYSYIVEDIGHTEKTGVYFIYDSSEELAYIGMSGTNVSNRCLQSTDERKLHDFSKIEIRSTSTHAEALIYESYFIHKLEPYMNRGFKDKGKDMTIAIPTIDITRIIKRHPTVSCIEYNYHFAKEKVMDVEEVLMRLNKDVFINNKQNKKMLESTGYNIDEYNARESAYIKKVDEIKSNNQCAFDIITGTLVGSVRSVVKLNGEL